MPREGAKLRPVIPNPPSSELRHRSLPPPPQSPDESAKDRGGSPPRYSRSSSAKTPHSFLHPMLYMYYARRRRRHCLYAQSISGNHTRGLLWKRGRGGGRKKKRKRDERCLPNLPPPLFSLEGAISSSPPPLTCAAYFIRPPLLSQDEKKRNERGRKEKIEMDRSGAPLLLLRPLCLFFPPWGAGRFGPHGDVF